MSTVIVQTTAAFDNRTFWIANSGQSTGEGFTDQTSQTGSFLSGHEERTYSTLTFVSGGLTYRYLGAWQITADNDLVTGSLSASGSYDRIEVLSGGQLQASYEGASRSVDFGTYSGGGVLGLLGNVLTGAIQLLFGGGQSSSSYANLHLDATPNLPALAYADGVTATGNAGADTLSGSTGNDTLDGRGGADVLAGGAGNDTYVVDQAGDQVIEAAGEGDDTVLATASYALGAGQAIERLAAADAAAVTALALTGNEVANIVTGNAGANVIDGGAGADTMQGLGGNDTYVVDQAGDQVIEAAGGGDDTVLATASYALGAGQAIERLAAADAAALAALNLTGNEVANVITGNAGANVITGGGGADTLQGLGGRDTFVIGDDLGTGGFDTILDFTPGQDLIALSSAFGSLAGTTLPADAFKDIATGALDATDRILYDSASGNLFYDADGSGSQAGSLIAVLSSRPALSGADFGAGSPAPGGNPGGPPVPDPTGGGTPSPGPGGGTGEAVTPVYRFFDTANGHHFYTADAAEYAGILARFSNFVFEGATWSTPATSAETTDVYRFFDMRNSDHFYTTDKAERDALINFHAGELKFEGVAFQAYTNANHAGALVLERFYNTITGDHHYSPTASETNGVRAGNAGPGWIDEGPSFIVAQPYDSGMLMA